MNNNIKDLWSIYESNVNISDLNPEDTTDNKSIYKIGRVKGISEESTDVVGEKIKSHEIDDNYKENGQNNIEIITNNTSDYLQNCFDIMNKD